MTIRNYTSKVPASESARKIEAHLVEAGATMVSKWYEAKQLIGFYFEIPIDGRPTTFRVPANVEKCYRKLLAQSGLKPHDTRRRAALRDQAARTAWRTLQELLQIQVEAILIEQVEPLEAFFSHRYDQATGQTLYEAVQAGTLRLLGPGGGEDETAQGLPVR